MRLEKVSSFVEYYCGLCTQIYLHMQSYCNRKIFKTETNNIVISPCLRFLF